MLPYVRALNATKCYLKYMELGTAWCIGERVWLPILTAPIGREI